MKKRNKLRTGLLTALIMSCFTGAAMAMPSGGSLAEGNVTVDAGSLAALPNGAIIHATENAVIDWTHFDIAAGETLHFDTSGGMIINRVRDGEMAEFLGKVTQIGTHPLYIVSTDGISMSGKASLAGTQMTLMSYGNLRADDVTLDGTQVSLAAAKISLKNTQIRSAGVNIAAVPSADPLQKELLPMADSSVYLDHVDIRSEAGRVELAAGKMTMLDSAIEADRIGIRVGAVSGSAEDMQMTAGAPLYLSNTFLHAHEVRSMSSAVCLVRGSEIGADNIDLSIGETIRVLSDADGRETREEIAVTRENTLSLWESYVTGAQISFRAGGVGLWRGSELGADRKVVPLIRTDEKNARYSVRRTDGSQAKMLCSMDSSVWQKSGDVRGFEAVSYTKTPPIVPAEP